jgi:Arylsulfotransferase (ASST)
MFEWTSLDHVAIADSYQTLSGSSLAFPYDFFHINSINLDADNTLLVSARNTWTVYELDPNTLQILWRLGGKHSSFHMAPGTKTAWQHDSREIGNDEFSIFDNGGAPDVHPQSRGIIVRVSPADASATLVTQFTHSPGARAASQGNVQLLSDGNFFIGWGQEPFFSEVNPGGEVVFNARLPNGDQSYRAFRSNWTGTPAHRPAFALARGDTAVYASWNGSTLDAAWRVLVGSSASALHAIAQAPRSGFETELQIPAPAHGSYITVQALDASGAVLATGPIERVG